MYIQDRRSDIEMKKKILFIVNYYTPYVSGLTEVVHLLAEKLVDKGYEVTVLCQNHDSKNLPDTEIINGVQIVRARIIAKISKGMLSLDFIYKAVKMSKKFDVINLHAPMLELGIITSLIKNKRPIVTYHCDIDLEKNFLNTLIKWCMNMSNSSGMKNAHKILVSTLDYAYHSKLLPKYSEKLLEVHTPIKVYYPIVTSNENLKKKIGFCGRIVMEKGVDVLIKAFKIIKEDRNDVELIIGGDYMNIPGGSIYPELYNYIQSNKIDDIKFLGKIPEDEMNLFYSSLSVFVLPSINPLEAFGMVQVEAMLCGIPVVASDLYGVRTIVKNTGMGLTHHKGDENDLARCIIEVLDNPSRYIKPREQISRIYSTEKYVSDCEICFNEVINH